MANIVIGEFSGLNDSLFGKSIAPIKRHVKKRAEAFEAQSLLPTLFDMRTSDNWAEKDTEETLKSALNELLVEFRTVE